MNKFKNTLDLYLNQKLPGLPTNMKEIVVKAAPWVMVLSLLLAYKPIRVMYDMYQAAQKYGGFMDIFGVGTSNSFELGIGQYIFFAALILRILSLNGLFKHKPSGWNFTFYFLLVYAIQGLFGYNLIENILVAVAGLYLLFQVKPYYFGGASLSSSSNPVATQPNATNTTGAAQSMTYKAQQQAQQPIQPEQPIQQNQAPNQTQPNKQINNDNN
jgi:hypothetical protein